MTHEQAAVKEAALLIKWEIVRRYASEAFEDRDGVVPPSVFVPKILDLLLEIDAEVDAYFKKKNPSCGDFPRPVQ